MSLRELLEARDGERLEGESDVEGIEKWGRTRDSRDGGTDDVVPRRSTRAADSEESLGADGEWGRPRSRSGWRERR
jgi:hypothetical protein